MRGRGHGPGRHAAGPTRRVLPGPLDDPPGGRGGSHRAEQLGLVTQHRQIAQAVTTVGQHHGQVPQHDRVRVAAPAAWGTPAQRAGQAKPVGQLTQQRRPGMTDHPGTVSGDFDAG